MAMYTPEVDIEQYPDLQDRKTEWNESWNSWIDNLAPQTRCMDACSLELYTFILADLWNTRVVQQSPTAAPHPAAPNTNVVEPLIFAA